MFQRGSPRKESSTRLLWTSPLLNKPTYQVRGVSLAPNDRPINLQVIACGDTRLSERRPCPWLWHVELFTGVKEDSVCRRMSRIYYNLSNWRRASSASVRTGFISRLLAGQREAKGDAVTTVTQKTMSTEPSTSATPRPTTTTTTATTTTTTTTAAPTTTSTTTTPPPSTTAKGRGAVRGDD